MNAKNQGSSLRVASTREIDSFISDFKYPCGPGFKASLNISCQNDRPATAVDFDVYFLFVLSPVEVSPSTTASLASNSIGIFVTDLRLITEVPK